MLTGSRGFSSSLRRRTSASDLDLELELDSPNDELDLDMGMDCMLPLHSDSGDGLTAG